MAPISIGSNPGSCSTSLPSAYSASRYITKPSRDTGFWPAAIVARGSLRAVRDTALLGDSHLLLITIRIISGLIGLVFFGAGLYEALRGTRLPRPLAWTLLPRNRPPTSRTWSSRRWRINGSVLILWSVALLTWAIAGFSETTVAAGLVLGWVGFGIGVWVTLTKLA